MYFENKDDYDFIDLEDTLEVKDFPAQIRTGKVEVLDVTKGKTFNAVLDLSPVETEVILDGGQLAHLKAQLKEMGVPTGADIKFEYVKAD